MGRGEYITAAADVSIPVGGWHSIPTNPDLSGLESVHLRGTDLAFVPGNCAKSCFLMSLRYGIAYKST